MTKSDDSRTTKAGLQNEEAFANIVANFFGFWSAAFAHMPESPADVSRASLLAALGSGKGGEENPGNAPLAAADFARALTAFNLLSRVHLAATLSAFRYGSNLTQAFGDHQSSFVRLISAQTSGSKLQEEDLRETLDDLRSWLREIGDLSSQEARIFQSELEKIGDEFVNTADVDTAPDSYRRRWKCKM